MPVTLTVSQVRDALYRADRSDEGRGDGSPSTAMLGSWFHQWLGGLIGDSSPAGPLARLAELDKDLELWKETLVADAYARFLGPRLTRHQAVLHGHSLEVMSLWRAMQEACGWLAELVWNVRPKNASRRSEQQAAWHAAADWFETEEPLSCELREPGWSDSVRLVGVADAVVRLSNTDHWCAIEFKLGQTSPAVDLGQACLYHTMLSAASNGRAVASDDGTLALLSFRPERNEQLFTASELKVSRERLVALIGKLAGVDAAQIDENRSPPVAAPTQEHLELGRGLVETLAEYGVDVSLDEPIIVGPAFVRFPIALGRGTTVKQVQKYPEELRVRLKLDADPLIILDGRGLSIDVQRPDRETIFFKTIEAGLARSDSPSGGSRVPVGIDLHQELVYADLAKPEHAHLLVAGTTGSGKSEWLRMAIAGLIATNTPETLRLLVIDPKRNAFHALRNSPFLWRPLVFPDECSVAQILAELAEEMDRRYRLFEGVDSFSQLIEKSSEPLPRIVCVCDEYRDLISRDRKERKAIEQQICRLGAKARASGIHLILATQEPSRDTIKGPLDSNIPARVGLKMGKALESRMLLNESGAERLLGHGDLLFKDIGDPRRLQAPLLGEERRAALFGSG